MYCKSFKYKLYPTKEQEVLLAKHFGARRFIYNYFLNKCKEFYLKNKEDIEAKRIKWWVNYYDWSKQLTQLKKQEKYIWLNEVNAQSLQSTLKDLEWAYRRFFRWQSKFPIFKNKHTHKSYSVQQNVRIDDKLYIRKFREWIDLNMHVEIEWRIITTTISQDRQWNYFVSITCECEIEPLPIIEKTIWIDLWIKTFAICSDWVEIPNPMYLKKKQDKLRYVHRKYSKYKWTKTKSRLSKLYWKVANQRKDFLHKISTQLIRENQIICIEDLDIKWMLPEHRLAKLISDCWWWSFTQMLEYKSNWYWRTLVKIDRFFPSSKMCNKCWWINQELKLKDRERTCKLCWDIVHRDLNASNNILQQGLNLLKNTAIRDDS